MHTVSYISDANLFIKTAKVFQILIGQEQKVRTAILCLGKILAGLLAAYSRKHSLEHLAKGNLRVGNAAYFGDA